MNVPFWSYSGTHTIKSSLVLTGNGIHPSIVLRDENGYYGFITDRAQLAAIRDWLIRELREERR